MVAVEKMSTSPPPEGIVTVSSDGLQGEFWRDIPGADVRIVTSGGRTISAHSSVLSSVSPVLENILLDRPRKRGNGPKSIPILGVPCNAVVAFLRCLYTSRCPEQEGEMEKYGVHLLVLSHVMRVAWLKRAVALALSSTLTAENVADMLQLARQCDAPRLHVRCMKLLRRDFKEVERTEGWRFVQENDPYLELEVLQFLEEADRMEERRTRNRREQGVYVELSEAMECLRHICTDGCTGVGPKERDDPVAVGEVGTKRRGPCGWGKTCEGVQRLIRHFAECERKKNRGTGGGCGRCARMWRLLRLHSAICDQTEEPCKVPLCKQFKERAAAEKKGEDKRWELLAMKVMSAKVISALSKRKRDDDLHHQHGSIKCTQM